MKRAAVPPVGSIVTPRREAFFDGIPLYASCNLQYDDTTPAPIGWLDDGTVGHVLQRRSPRGTFTSVRVLGGEVVGWTAAAYIAVVGE